MDNNKIQVKDDKGNDYIFFSTQPSVNNSPIFKPNKKAWIEYGKNNLYPNYLLDILNNSSKHNAIVKRKADMTAGNGWDTSTASPQLTAFIENPTTKEDLDTIAFKNGYDLNVYGSFAMIITWSKDRTSIARIKYLDLSKVRIAKMVEESEDPIIAERQADGVEFYYISRDWTSVRKEANKPEIMQGFSEKWNDVATQIVYTIEYRPQTDFYALPDYVASITWMDLDKQIADFHLNSVLNGFTPSMVINFNRGVPSKEKARKIANDINKNFSDVANANKAFITFSESKDESPDFIPIQLNDTDERFLMLETHIAQNIISGHRLTSPILAGIATAGKLGTRNEIIEAELMYQNNVINQKQRLIEKTFQKLANINGITDQMKLEKTTSFINNNIPNTPDNANE